MIEEPLRDNRGFIESREHECVCVILYGEKSPSLFPTSEQESSPRMHMDRGGVEVGGGEANENERSFDLHHRQGEKRVRSHAYSVA